jgi:hypothetical protein
MDKSEVIEKMCELATMMGEAMGNEHAHDCFCSNSQWNLRDFQFSKVVMDEIENAISERIQNYWMA